MYDIIIIGGGPAGATLARLLAGKFKIILIDKKGSGFRKCCGGLLSPGAQRSLARMDMSLPTDVLVNPQAFAVKTLDLESSIIRTYQRAYVNMDRHAFDLWLLSLLDKETVKVEENAICTAVSKTEEGFCVRYKTEDGEKEITAKYIVGADGANSLVRKTFFSRKIPSFTAMQQWFPHEQTEALHSAIFDNSLTPSYAWGLSKNEYYILGAALPEKGAAQSFESLKERLQSFGYNFGEPAKTEACKVLRPASFRDLIPGKDGVFLIGEAGGFISPSSLEGISYALDTAQLLAKAFIRDFYKVEKYYKRDLLPIYMKLFNRRMKMPFMYNRLLRRLVMKSGVTAIR
jgi:flavin-dependent dehydrogenase